MNAVKIFCILLSLLIGLTGCSKPQATTGPAITGTIRYRTPLALDADTVLQLKLTDVSISDGPALEIASATITDIETLPFDYSLPYEPSRIDASHRYTVEARLLTAGQLRFSTDTAYAVLTQNQGAQRDLEVVAVGSNETGAIPLASADVTVFQGELRSGAAITLYKAGLRDGHVQWLEEDRSNGTPQPLHARYDFNGALITHYADSFIEISFDERGRPVKFEKNQQSLKPSEQLDAINAVRNRAALLRSHALAASEARAHRQATGG